MKAGGNSRVAAVTGGTGVVGPIIIRRLLERQYVVRALVLSAESACRLPASVETVIGDINDPKAVDGLVDGANVVLHLAAKLHVVNPTSVERREYERINIAGTRTLARACERARVDRTVFFSTINVYGASQIGEILDENSVARPLVPYAQSKLQGESVMSDYTECVVLRLASVYGPRMKGNYASLVSAVNRGISIVPGTTRKTLVYINDVADAALLAAEHSAAPGGIFNVTDGCIHTLNDISAAIAAAFDRPVPRIRVNVNKLRRALGWCEDLGSILSVTSPVGRFTVDKLLEDMAVSGAKMIEKLGFRPKYDLRSGWREFAA